jgi:hypothetical protein
LPHDQPLPESRACLGATAHLGRDRLRTLLDGALVVDELAVRPAAQGLCLGPCLLKELVRRGERAWLLSSWRPPPPSPSIVASAGTKSRDGGRGRLGSNAWAFWQVKRTHERLEAVRQATWAKQAVEIGRGSAARRGQLGHTGFCDGRRFGRVVLRHTGVDP